MFRPFFSYSFPSIKFHFCTIIKMQQTICFFWFLLFAFTSINKTKFLRELSFPKKQKYIIYLTLTLSEKPKINYLPESDFFWTFSLRSSSHARRVLSQSCIWMKRIALSWLGTGAAADATGFRNSSKGRLGLKRRSNFLTWKYKMKFSIQQYRKHKTFF